MSLRFVALILCASAVWAMGCQQPEPSGKFCYADGFCIDADPPDGLGEDGKRLCELLGTCTCAGATAGDVLTGDGPLGDVDRCGDPVGGD